MKEDELLARSEWEACIEEYIIGKNAYRDKEMLKESLLDGRPYEWIAEKWGLSPRRVADIIPKRHDQLCKALDKKKIT